MTATYDAASLPDLLPIYYKKLFPYGPYFRWLNYGGGKSRSQRVVWISSVEKFIKYREKNRLGIIQRTGEILPLGINFTYVGENVFPHVGRKCQCLQCSRILLTNHLPTGKWPPKIHLPS